MQIKVELRRISLASDKITFISGETDGAIRQSTVTSFVAVHNVFCCLLFSSTW